MSLWFVSATRLARDAFDRESMLARSLRRIEPYTPCVIAVAYENRRPLADAYNIAIERAKPDDRIVFVHDDVWIDDWYVGQRVDDALAVYDVVGVAGNRVRAPRSPGWVYDGARVRLDQPSLSGGVVHGAPDRPIPSRYGPTPAEARMLDGVFLAARAGTLQERGVRFDPRFPFHFYDMDFCRACEQAGLRLGTWPIAITHGSGGTAGDDPSFDRGYRDYLAKWGD